MNLKKIDLSKTIIIGRGKKARATHPDINVGFKKQYLIWNKISKTAFVGEFCNPDDLCILHNVGGIIFTWYLSLQFKQWEIYEIVVD